MWMYTSISLSQTTKDTGGPVKHHENESQLWLFITHMQIWWQFRCVCFNWSSRAWGLQREREKCWNEFFPNPLSYSSQPNFSNFNLCSCVVLNKNVSWNTLEWKGNKTLPLSQGKKIFKNHLFPERNSKNEKKETF